jgi:membrane complex biogenesis BtpA family protein
MEWIPNTFGTKKPIIAMCHFQPMPGDLYYDAKAGMQKVVDFAREEFLDLQEVGVDAVMFSNEFSLPYMTKVNPETTAAMARVIGELMPLIKIPFGVNVLWDPFASIDLAAATGAKFIREIMSGVYSSDFGLWNTDCGAISRHRARLFQHDLKLMYNIVPEASKYLGDRDVADIARSTVFNCKPEIICVSGMTAGIGADMGVLDRVKNAIPETAVFANTGCRVDTIEDILKIADGAVVGTTFKKDGKFENRVDKARVAEFMDKVRSVR